MKRSFLSFSDTRGLRFCAVGAGKHHGHRDGFERRPVPGAPVTITNKATNVQEHVATTSTGDYNAPNLVPGVYRVEVAVSGFRIVRGR